MAGAASVAAGPTLTQPILDPQRCVFGLPRERLCVVDAEGDAEAWLAPMAEARRLAASEAECTVHGAGTDGGREEDPGVFRQLFASACACRGCVCSTRHCRPAALTRTQGERCARYVARNRRGCGAARTAATAQPRGCEHAEKHGAV